jgi:hypothetical protein
MSVARDVRYYLKNRPYLLEALERGIVNFSSLSRLIGRELQTDQIVAIKAAVRRFATELQKRRRRREARVLRVLRGSRIGFYDGVKVVITRNRLGVASKLEIPLEGAFVYVLDRTVTIPRQVVIASHANVGVFTINSPTHIETTPGVVAYLTSLLAEEDINIIEFISCYTHTIIIVAKADVLRTYEILSRVIG